MFIFNFHLSIKWTVIAVIILAFKGSGALQATLRREAKDTEFTCTDPKGGFYPHKICNKYYECRTQATLHQCPPNQLFNEKIGICYKKAFTDCNDRHVPDDHDDKTIEDFSKDLNPQCPSTEGIFPHETRCDLFYMCSTTLKVHSCIYNHNFNVQMGVCFHKNWTPCSDPIKPPVGTTPSYLNDRNITKFPVDVDYFCPAVDKYFPHEKYCELYYACDERGATLNKCPDDMLFHKDIGLCFQANVTPCDNRERPEDDVTEVTTDPTMFTDAKISHFKERTESDTTEVQTESPSPAVTESTTVLTTSGEDDEITCPTRVAMFRHPKYPNKFVHCDHFIPHIKDCPDSLVFNNQLQVCDYTTGE